MARRSRPTSRATRALRWPVRRARRTMARYGRRQPTPRPVPAGAGRHRARDAGAPPTTVARRLRRADQAADHRAAADHHRARRWCSPSGGWPSTWLVLVTLVGGTLAAGGANAINMYVDRDIDAPDAAHPGSPARHRRRSRPRRRSSFALALEVVAFAVLWAGANLLAAVLALGGHRVLRRRLHALAEAHEHARTSSSAAPPAPCPVLVGWAAVTEQRSAGRRSCCSWSMFLWTPPHFWALAIRYADDYRAANVPMLPGRRARSSTPCARWSATPWRWSRARWCSCRSPTSAGSTASPPSCSARCSSRPRSGLGRNPTPQRSMRVFGYQHHLRHAAVRRADARRPGRRPCADADLDVCRGVGCGPSPTDLRHGVRPVWVDFAPARASTSSVRSVAS